MIWSPLNDHKVEIDMNSITTEKENTSTSRTRTSSMSPHPVSNYDVTSITKPERASEITGNLTMRVRQTVSPLPPP